MENLSYEAASMPLDAAYEQNHDIQLELMGRINARLSAKYRADKPRGWEHVGEQDEVIAMLRSVAELLNA